ncbi:hypothetical protein [Bradyrhizobium genosp. L]|uniref:hypothetical protein n=1 Tax=Bradyrhizobium genosp. L TaxID=83637 RepID=UPI001FEE7A60|nr:hypothetical protein [Bradyrhizobium genosp. L]
MTWSREFTDPIELPGKTLRTLQEAADHILSLPKAQQQQPHWQDAVEHLIKAAEREQGWVLFAWMFMLRAINHGQPEEPRAPRKKAVKGYRIIR